MRKILTPKTETLVVQATAAGGSVTQLLGNHELMTLQVKTKTPKRLNAWTLNRK